MQKNSLKTNPILGIVVGAALLSASAQVTINVGKIPITAQSFVVCLLGYWLPPRVSLVALALYTVLGICGLPIFADGSSGWQVLAEGSAGYFVGFFLSCIFLQKISKERTYFYILFGQMLVATLLILLCGTVYLCFLYGIKDGFAYGFYPFVLGGLFKSTAAAVLNYYLHKFIHKK